MAKKGQKQGQHAFARRCATPASLRYRIRKDKQGWHRIEANMAWDDPMTCDRWKPIAKFRDRDEGLEYLAVKLGHPDLFIDKLA